MIYVVPIKFYAGGLLFKLIDTVYKGSLLFGDGQDRIQYNRSIEERL